MKKLIAVILAALVLVTVFAACGKDGEVVAGQKNGESVIGTTVTDDRIIGSWYFVGEEDHFMEFHDDGTAKNYMVPDVTYTYTFNGHILTLTKPNFSRTYECYIDDDGFLHYTWFDKGTPVKETCEKR